MIKDNIKSDNVQPSHWKGYIIYFALRSGDSRCLGQHLSEYGFPFNQRIMCQQQQDPAPAWPIVLPAVATTHAPQADTPDRSRVTKVDGHAS